MIGGMPMLRSEDEISPIPEMTRRVAQAAFPQGNVYLWMRDEIGQVYCEAEFADLYDSRKGQPGVSAWRLALVCVMQYLEDLSDRQAAEAVRGRIDWKYALGLELDDSGFDYSVLSEFRQRLVSGAAEQRLLDRFLGHFAAKGWVKERGQQRTDSTHVLAAIRTLNRLEAVAEMLRATLNEIAIEEPAWLQSWVPAIWYGRYGKAVEDYHLPKKAAERTAYGEQVGRDGMMLLERLWQEETPLKLRQLQRVEQLRHYWVQQFYVVAGQVRLRPVNEIPPSGRRLDSPYDVDARYGHKRDETWRGYKVHVSETCDPNQVHLITQVQTTPAQVQDVEQTALIHAALAAKSLLPKDHFVDAGYVDADLLVTSQTTYGISLIGPVRPDSSWQAQQPDADDLTHFQVDWEQQVVTCPQGHPSQRWRTAQDARRRTPVIRVKFAKSTCATCPVRHLCTQATEAGRELTLSLKEAHQALHQRRQQQSTLEWWHSYQARAGIEGTISQAVACFGMRQSRYRGLAKTHLQHLIAATAINLKRAFAWFHQQIPHAKSRISRFAALAQPSV